MFALPAAPAVYHRCTALRLVGWYSLAEGPNSPQGVSVQGHLACWTSSVQRCTSGVAPVP